MHTFIINVAVIAFSGLACMCEREAGGQAETERDKDRDPVRNRDRCTKREEVHSYQRRRRLPPSLCSVKRDNLLVA